MTTGLRTTDLLEFIGEYIIANGYPPSNSEIATALATTTQTVRSRLVWLHDTGRIRYVGSRGIFIIPEALLSDVTPTPEEIDWTEKMIAALLPNYPVDKLKATAVRVAKLRKNREANKT